MQGIFVKVDSKRTLATAHKFLDETFEKHKFFAVKAEYGKQTLLDDSICYFCYWKIAKHRKNITTKHVERECKYLYGLPILRRDPMHEYVFSKAVDLLSYEKRIKVMDCFAVTSIMSAEQKDEYLKKIKSAYPFLIDE